jgi:hypothetical protein
MSSDTTPDPTTSDPTTTDSTTSDLTTSDSTTSDSTTSDPTTPDIESEESEESEPVVPVIDPPDTTSDPVIDTSSTSSATAITSSSFSRPKSQKNKKKSVVDLCDFAATELVHDFGKIEPRKGEPEITGISIKRYDKSKVVFDRILSDGLNSCSATDSFIKYTEPEILQQITGANFKANISNNTLNNTNITVSTGSIYNVKITSKTEINESSPGVFDDSQCGIKLFDNLFKDDAVFPILLIDTDGGITKYLKTGNSGGANRQVYIFSPVVVRADSAPKMNLTSKKSLTDNFSDPDGIQFINVMDNEPFTTTVASDIKTSDGFFSKYEIKSYESGENINQEWSGFSKIGTGTGSDKVLIRADVNNTNNRNNIAKKIDPLINVGNNEISGPSNMAKMDKTNIEAAKNREIFNSEIQSKRSGDWLPVLYILKYTTDKDKDLKTYTNPIDPKTKAPFTAPATFNKNNMYIVTIDQPLVAYALYSGVNVIYIDGKGNFIKLKKK